MTSQRKVKKGGTLQLPLTDQGRKILSGCGADQLQSVVRSKTKKKGKGKAKKRTTTYRVPLDRDLAVCSKGSENPTPRPYKGPAIDTSNANRCDFMDPTVCLQPWPNDYFTVPDSSTADRPAAESEHRLDARQHAWASTSTRPTTTGPTASARAT